MSYFSRLTDIVTCSVTKLLAEASDPRQAIVAIIAEMEEGLAGAKRSVATAQTNENLLRQELEEHRPQVGDWADKAKQELAAGKEDQARLALVRKREASDLIAGLEVQFSAAASTREHLTTTLRALEARLAEARRKQRELVSGHAESDTGGAATTASSEVPVADRTRWNQIDEELEALKRELEGHA